MPTLALPDGRCLGYAEWGDPAGAPLFFFHGIPGSRLFRYPDDALTRRTGVRLITVDRPGMGLSAPLPGRRLLDWPRDVAALAQHLGLARYAVAGVSGGGPYALACARVLGQAVTRVGMLSSLAPFQSPQVVRAMQQTNPWIIRGARLNPLILRCMMIWGANKLRKNPLDYLRWIAGYYAEPDRRVLDRADIQAICMEDIVEAYRQGIAGHMQDIRTAAQPWGFDLGGIATPVLLWHGAADSNVPPAVTRFLAEALPNATARVLPGEGHLVVLSHWEEILRALVD